MSDAAQEIIIFDLDGTLLDGDSTTVWMIQAMLKSPIRTIVGVLLAPFILPTVLIPAMRKLNGASIMLWVATAGWSEARLKASFDEFSQSVERKTTKLSWRENGLKQVKSYQSQGRTAVIATAAPEWLAAALFKAIDCDVKIVGSSLKRIIGGWMANQHCHGKKKCAMLGERDLVPHGQ